MAAAVMCAVSVGRILRSCSHSKRSLRFAFKVHLCQIARLKSQWQLVAALCLERKPIVTQELSAIEREFKAYLDKVEVEQSLLSDHELRVREELVQAKKVSDDDYVVDAETALKSTSQDEDEAFTEEFNQFKPAPRITDADKTDNVKSLQRHLDKHLVFLVKQKLGNDLNWGLPQAVRQKGETMQEVAERVCKEVCGAKLNAVFLGKAPVGYCKYKYPKAAREEGVLGAKVFFFKAWHKNGDLCPQTFKSNHHIEDYMWATRSELSEKLSQKDYRKSIQSFLVDETDIDEKIPTSENIDATHVEDFDNNRQALVNN